MNAAILFVIIEISIFGYFFYVSFYNLLLSIAAHFGSKTHFSKVRYHKKIAVIIPCYKEDSIILDSVEKALKIDYPSDSFKILVLADSFSNETLLSLEKYPIEVIEIDLEQSTKVKAINRGLKLTNYKAEVMVILDADNVMELQFLSKVNSLFHEGNRIVQGRRKIKNKLNDLTFLDDLSEQINNHINRKGVSNLGWSSSISGSGFAVDYQLGLNIFKSLNSVGGFDKEFELELIKLGHRTKYFENIEVFDEKVKKNIDFQNQRTRWIASQYQFLIKNFGKGFKSLFVGDFTFFNSAILRNIQLPRLLNLGIFSIIIVLIVFNHDILFIAMSAWLIIYSAFILSIIVAIPREYYNLKLVKVISKLPAIFVIMLRIMFKLKGANRRFIHTPHYKTPLGDD